MRTATDFEERMAYIMCFEAWKCIDSSPCPSGFTRQVLMVAPLVANNASEAVLAPRVGLEEAAFGECLESAVRRSVLCWCVWHEYGFRRREYVYTFNLHHEDIL
jgi:hypothetical protein